MSSLVFQEKKHFQGFVDFISLSLMLHSYSLLLTYIHWFPDYCRTIMVSLKLKTKAPETSLLQTSSTCDPQTKSHWKLHLPLWSFVIWPPFLLLLMCQLLLLSSSHPNPTNWILCPPLPETPISSPSLHQSLEKQNWTNSASNPQRKNKIKKPHFFSFFFFFAFFLLSLKASRQTNYYQPASLDHDRLLTNHSTPQTLIFSTCCSLSFHKEKT